jgi:hypothetical protein
VVEDGGCSICRALGILLMSPWLPHAGTTFTTCFSGDSKVVVQGRRDPVAIRDVRVGESVMCFEGGADLSTPGAPRWCTVRSFVSQQLTSSQTAHTCMH